MTETDAKNKDRKEVPEIDLADPDDYHRRQRLKEIHKCRQRVHKTLDSTDRYTRLSEHKKQTNSLIDAVALYIAELEPLIERTEASPELPESIPWDTVTEYADKLGSYMDDGQHEKAHYAHSLKVFRACNRYLAEVRPIIEENDTDEWEV
jgi:hypothetical protein